MFTENLDDYLKAEQSQNCYLDGRYFYKVFLNYPGTISEPLKIFLSERRDGQIQVAAQMRNVNINPEYPGLLRVVIQTPASRHSNLLVLDYQEGKAYRFEPHGLNGPAEREINQAIENYLAFFLNLEVEMIEVDLPEVVNDDCIKEGLQSGFCNAYIIMMAYAYVNDKPYRFSEPRRFAGYIEQQYGSLPQQGAEIEYGLFDGQGFRPNPRNAAIGGAVGLGAGALLGGVGGAAIGGLGGLAVGSLL